jgi:predicted dienelactone hydrolase
MVAADLLGRKASRRALTTGALAVAAGAWLAVPKAGGGTPAIAAVQAGLDERVAVPRLSLPAPTGRYPVGTTSLHLVDRNRVDPLAPTPRHRELMVQLWYPASPQAVRAAAAYLPPGVASGYTQFINAATGTTYPDDLLTFATNSLSGVPAAGSRRPVVLFSPGFGLSAALYTGLHEELASRGYVVAGVDHTFDAGAVEFPDGRVELQRPGLVVDDVLLGTRVADVRFVLDRLAVLSAGGNPDVERRRLPVGLGRATDSTRVAAYGHSLGSPTVVSAIDQDRRIDAGAALDGNPIGTASLGRPFLLMGNQTHRFVDDPDWAAFYERLRGSRRYLVIDGAEHADLSDVTLFKSALDVSGLFEVGPIDGQRALAIERAYLTAWLDQALLHRPNVLLRGESSLFPEVDFQP